MSVKKLSDDIQSIICSSCNLSNYKRTVEELVYNSLDAKSTSIAIRIHIQENQIQVVDNGCGIAKKDFKLLGQRFATSKYVNLSNFKSVPNTYGFRGQALSSMVDVSKHLKITSRIEGSEKTWCKSFCAGKEKDLLEVDPRPSKGTTVEISEFLYNAKIQKKSINALQELNDIKTFLEQLSLVHCNISLTLRDDSTNEIVFKMHKNRDIYQKIKTLFDIEKADIQELQVEKHEYKSLAYIGKTCDEITFHHWIFLNKKIVKNSKLNKLVQKYFDKHLKLSCKIKKAKSKLSGDNIAHRKCIPFYIIFLSCPYIDYEISSTPKNSVLEFKDWKPITSLLEKLIKFYFGDIHLKETKVQEIPNNLLEMDIREKVREITRKFLGSNSKKVGISQMQNGIKGKLIKRKKKKQKGALNTGVPLQKSFNNLKKNEINITSPKVDEKVKALNTCLKQNKYTKLQSPCNETNTAHFTEALKSNEIDNNSLEVNNNKNKPSRTVKTKTLKPTNKVNDAVFPKKPLKSKSDPLFQIFENQPENVKRTKRVKHAVMPKTLLKRKSDPLIQIFENQPEDVKRTKKVNNAVISMKPLKSKSDPLIQIFENQPEDVKKRCQILAKEAENALLKHQTKQTVYINETVNYCNFVKDNKNISIRKRVGEVIIHDIIPLKKKLNVEKRHVDQKKSFQTSHNLLRTIINSQQVPCYSPEVNHSMNRYNKKLPSFRNPKEVPQLTYESHNYNRNQDAVMSHYNMNKVQPDHIATGKELSPLTESCNCKNDKNIHFISKQSRDNFAMPESTNMYLKLHNKKVDSFRRNALHFRNMNIFNEDVDIINTLSYTNHLSNNVCEIINLSDIESMHLDKSLINTNHNESEIRLNENITQQDEIRPSYKSSNFGFTYTITSSNMIMNMDNISFKNYEYDTDFSGDNFNINTSQHLSKCKDENNVNENQRKIVFVSKLQDSMDALISSSNLEPINVCEPIINSSDSNHQNKIDLMSNYNEDNVSNNEDNSPSNNYQIQKLSVSNNADNYSPSNNYQNQYLSVTDGNGNVGDNLNLPSKRPLPSNDLLTDSNVDRQHNLEVNTEAIIDENNEIGDHDLFTESNYFTTEQIEKGTNCNNTNMFNIRNRPRYLPKGMSPIFENCNSKSVCDYNFDKEYFEDTLYDNFNNDVQTNIDVYEAEVQHAKDITTKAIEKFSSRLEKDHSNLTFSTKSIQEARVLAQVDNKFIATILKGNLEGTTYLVLFDQHAVHERIRLEKNLSDYFDGNEWKRVNLDDVSLKMSKEEIMYLHNYRDKFNQFGLQWTIVDSNEIKFQSIPLAILGKNPREVDKVMKTVKNLISEEINNIISQKGCVSVYPKTIMDLVNNEACRYAIMFGDTLSKKDCIELLESLSTCKTPFQCAHGRPVMAVIMEFKPKYHEFKVNLNKVLQFKTKYKNK